MSKSTEQISKGGSVHVWHQRKDDVYASPEHDEQYEEALREHLANHIGQPSPYVMHEHRSEGVHLDLLHVLPTADRPVHTLVTCGMASKPMAVPEGMEGYERCELLICLPAEWPVGSEVMYQPEYFWPIEWLKLLARYPHTHEAWLWSGHTVPTSDPPEPMGPNTQKSGMLISEAVLAPASFDSFAFRGNDVFVFAVFPLYAEEMEYKLEYGAPSLLELFDKADVTEIVQPDRAKVVSGPE